MVATVHPLATDAGLDAIRRGGNAIDAAVAAALTLGVVDAHNSGLGGGCFVLIRTADGRFAAIDGRERAPLRAHRDMFLKDGVAQEQWSKVGALASGTPGALAAYQTAIEHHGALSLSQLLRPAAKLAEDGFPIDAVYAGDLVSTAGWLRQFPSTAAVLLKPDGTVHTEGEILRQPDLAATYRGIADQGIDWFYQGPFAMAVEEWMATAGGLLTRADFAAYRAVERQPIETPYRDVTVVGFPPPSSGGVHVAQILNMLEHFELQSLHREDDAKYVHVVVEAMKLAFADRAHWLGDPDFAAVPLGLIDKSYAKSLVKQIDLQRAKTVAQHGTPPRSDREVFHGLDRHTTHIAAADADGNWVAITATVNTTFGSKVIIPGTGVVMNNEMDDFSIQPGIPNAFGLLGAEANAIEPGKRPLSSMSPTIVLRDGQPIMTIGAAGGPTIINQVVLGIIRYIDLKQPISDALSGARFHHQWSPDRLLIESSLAPELIRQLQHRGHQIVNRAKIGVTQAIVQDGSNLIGIHDPRVPGKAAGF